MQTEGLVRTNVWCLCRCSSPSSSTSRVCANNERVRADAHTHPHGCEYLSARTGCICMDTCIHPCGRKYPSMRMVRVRADACTRSCGREYPSVQTRVSIGEDGLHPWRRGHTDTTCLRRRKPQSAPVFLFLAKYCQMAIFFSKIIILAIFFQKLNFSSPIFLSNLTIFHPFEQIFIKL
jgi:hypothetical protein